uniref:Uncharacterized protein n=1 Tax=Myotis myotis TaxID=51298 RepID=A0A7J7XZP3_MYOMY|nr:hypothetical protein mMyoMyo1_011350 [Myotis myotis]
MRLHQIISTLHYLQRSEFVMSHCTPIPPAFCLLCELVKATGFALCLVAAPLHQVKVPVHVIHSRDAVGFKSAKESRGALWPSRLGPAPGPSLTQGVSLLPCSQVSAMRPVTVQSEQSCLMCSSCSRVTPSVSATGLKC